MNVTKAVQQICQWNNGGANLLVQGQPRQAYPMLQQAIALLKQLHKHRKQQQQQQQQQQQDTISAGSIHQQVPKKTEATKNKNNDKVMKHEIKYRRRGHQGKRSSYPFGPKPTNETTTTTTTTVHVVPAILATEEQVPDTTLSLSHNNNNMYTYKHAILLDFSNLTTMTTTTNLTDLELIHIVTVATAVVLFNKALSLVWNEKELPRCTMIYQTVIRLLKQGILLQSRDIRLATTNETQRHLLDLESLLLVGWNNLAQVYYEMSLYQDYAYCLHHCTTALSRTHVFVNKIAVESKAAGHEGHDSKGRRQATGNSSRPRTLLSGTGIGLTSSIDLGNIALNGKVGGVPGAARAA